jgi:hypothetical protein
MPIVPMRVAASVVVGGLAGLTAVGVGQPAPDFAHATELYNAAETAMTEQRYADAIRDYAAAYDITKDPVLFYKLGSANERAGNCQAALTYYAGYLKEAKPTDRFKVLTEAHIRACGGDPAALEAAGSGSGSGSAGGSGSAAPGDSDAGSGSGSALPPMTLTRHGTNASWLLVGGAIAFVTVGGVLAYSAGSSEQDIKDLYAGLGGRVPAWNAATQKRYQDLVDEGHRYQHLSWAAFGVGIGLGAAAAYLFYRHPTSETTLHVAPAVSPHTAGVTARVRF